VNSLDPRVNRLPDVNNNQPVSKADLDQLVTFEVFVQPREGKPFQHEGALHAPDIELAFVLAKEAFTRRFTCVSLFVAPTHEVFVSSMTEGSESVYDLITENTGSDGEKVPYEIFHLNRRGKQHVHAGSVEAVSPEEAFSAAGKTLRPAAVVFNLWAIRRSAIRFTTAEENDMWFTLPDKKFRDASDYKAGDKLKEFLEKQ
jgi:ring-1,2-phenylacetyl-CoA epoxidase subunit PaaB